MRKNRRLAIYPQPQFHDIVFSSKELSPLTLTEVDGFRSAGSVIVDPPTSHNPYDLNPFSSPVFSSFRPHLLLFLPHTSLCGMVGRVWIRSSVWI